MLFIYNNRRLQSLLSTILGKASWLCQIMTIDMIILTKWPDGSYLFLSDPEIDLLKSVELVSLTTI